MFNATNIFPMTLDAGQNYSNINADGDPVDADSVLYDVSGTDFGDVFNIIFVDVSSDTWNILGTVAMLGGALFLAWVTHSPAPFVVAVIANVFKNTYVNSIGFLEQFPINNYMMLAGMLGMIILLVVTCLEYLTHGDA